MSKYYWLNDESRAYLSRGYLSEGETAEERIWQIANKAEEILGIQGFAEKFEDYLSRGWYSLSSPIWSNFSKDRGLPISCFGSYIGDSMEDILEKAAEVGMMTKAGGGTSAYFGGLRGRGSKISSGGESTGSVHFMEIFDKLMNVVSQGNVRRGSFAAYLPVDHPDILEFLRIRDTSHTIQEMSIGVCISDQWMNDLLEKKKENMTVWKKILEKRASTGYPYIVFSDTANNNAPQVYKDKGLRINNSNLCVAPETLLLTKNGHEIIADLDGQDIEIWNGEQWSLSKVAKTGISQKIVKVTLSDGKTLECTPYHRWYVVGSYEDQRNGVYREKRTHELKEGDKLIKFECPVINGSERFVHPYSHGAFCGDGTYESNGWARLSLYGEKDAVLDRLAVKANRGRDASGRLNIILDDKIARKFKVPHNSSINTKLRWLEGYLDMDGTIARNGENESIQVASIEIEFLKEVQLMLQTLGVNAKIVHAADEGERLMPDGRGGSRLFSCKEAKRLLISSNGLYQLSLLGFSPTRLKFNQRLPQRDASQFVKVVSVIDEGRYDDTYCVSEPTSKKAIFNGILTGNCNEIMLANSESESFVCDLSSINLLHYDEWKDTDAVETLIYFLDAVMSEFISKTENMKFMDAPRRFAVNQRALGLGVLGWHSYLQSKMIAFESMDAKLTNAQIWKNIAEKCDKATKELAVLLGEPPLLEGYGIRNSTTRAIAPTTSSSFILGQVSPSIEPLNSNYFVKDLAKGKFTFKNPYLKKLLKEKGESKAEVWKSILTRGGSVQHLEFLSQEEKDVFKTFGEISQMEIVNQAATRQKYVDQGQSLNLMIPPNTPPKEISILLIEGWKKGLKGFYYQRSFSPVQELARSILHCSSCES